ncbi:MAG: hypothetical protein M1829_000928 [Trizodia sp. TS-e1964]|nr:MAG: hypothetical protein M1829_000928 [Trizodia sp. TS-e1964]
MPFHRLYTVLLLELISCLLAASAPDAQLRKRMEIISPCKDGYLIVTEVDAGPQAPRACITVHARYSHHKEACGIFNIVPAILPQGLKISVKDPAVPAPQEMPDTATTAPSPSELHCFLNRNNVFDCTLPMSYIEAKLQWGSNGLQTASRNDPYFNLVYTNVNSDQDDPQIAPAKRGDFTDEFYTISCAPSLDVFD